MRPDIEVSVASAEVTLSGTVGDRQSKRRAENIAANVLGVKDVQNSLRVRQVDPFSTGREAASMNQGSSAPTQSTTTTSTGATTGSTSPVAAALGSLRRWQRARKALHCLGSARLRRAPGPRMPQTPASARMRPSNGDTPRSARITARPLPPNFPGRGIHRHGRRRSLLLYGTLMLSRRTLRSSSGPSPSSSTSRSSSPTATAMG